LASAAICGKNGSGKSNLIHAFYTAVYFICNASSLQHESALIPVEPFLLNDFSFHEPTSFEFIYTSQSQKYWYGFTACKEKILEEYLYCDSKGKKMTIFKREEQSFTFTKDKAKRKLIAQTVAQNQLYFANACLMNDIQCKEAMHWFRNEIFVLQNGANFTVNRFDSFKPQILPQVFSELIENENFEIEKIELEADGQILDENALSHPTKTIQKAVSEFLDLLFEDTNEAKIKMQRMNVQATFFHSVMDENGQKKLYPLDITKESAGTRRWIALMVYALSALETGGVFVLDQIEKDLHPLLVNDLIRKFQSSQINPNKAQLLFTANDTNLLESDLLSNDQIYLVEKKNDGISYLYRNEDQKCRTQNEQAV
jgi:AAA15 family ATPase/GTPase